MQQVIIFLFCLTLVYVDASDQCNIAAFQLGQTAVGTTLAQRSWNIKVKITRTVFTRENVEKLCDFLHQFDL